VSPERKLRHWAARTYLKNMKTKEPRVFVFSKQGQPLEDWGTKKPNQKKKKNTNKTTAYSTEEKRDMKLTQRERAFYSGEEARLDEHFLSRLIARSTRTLKIKFLQSLL